MTKTSISSRTQKLHTKLLYMIVINTNLHCPSITTRFNLCFANVDVNATANFCNVKIEHIDVTNF